MKGPSVASGRVDIFLSKGPSVASGTVDIFLSKGPSAGQKGPYHLTKRTLPQSVI